jgi:hypothetical protein
MYHHTLALVLHSKDKYSAIYVVRLIMHDCHTNAYLLEVAAMTDGRVPVGQGRVDLCNNISV